MWIAIQSQLWRSSRDFQKNHFPVCENSSNISDETPNNCVALKKIKNSTTPLISMWIQRHHLQIERLTTSKFASHPDTLQLKLANFNFLRGPLVCQLWGWFRNDDCIPTTWNNVKHSWWVLWRALWEVSERNERCRTLGLHSSDGHA